MSIFRLSLSVSALLVVAAPALAQDVSVSAGVSLLTEYESNGTRQSDGPAVQGYIQADLDGFYAGIWASNVDPVILGGDRLEYDLYLGYANTVGTFSYDLGYARYYYNDSGFCCGDVIFSGEMALSDAISVGAQFSSDPDGFDVINSRLYGSLSLTDAVSMDARYGDISGEDGHSYWSVGINHAVSEASAVFASFHGTSIEDEDNLFLAGVSIDFSLR